MSAEKRIVIHVGIHKTGSTSIQEFLRSHRIALHGLDVDFYLGAFNPRNHVELHAAAIRLERDCPFKLNKGLVVDESFRESVQARVRQYIAQSQSACMIFSAEGLSYLRYEDEMERLQAMIPEGHIDIVMYLRDSAGFLASYRSEMTKHRMPPTIERDSFAYTADDSWLVDFESRLASFRKAFGTQNVIALDYDHELRTAGSVIPSFLNVVGVGSHFRAQDWNGIFLNPTVSSKDENSDRH